MKQISYIGVDSILYLKEILNKENIRNVFLIRGRNSYKYCGAEKAMLSIFNDYPEVIIYEFYNFSENPKWEDLQEGLLKFNEQKSDCIIAIGGGSIIDMAKLINFFSAYVGNIESAVYKQKKDILPFVAIPTTAGTGSEATHFAVLYKNGMKYSVAHEQILPKYAIVDPRFTYNSPAYLSSCTGFDALSQAIESLWSVHSTEESITYSTEAIHLLWQNLPKVIQNDLHARQEVSRAAFLAGKAINIAKTTAAHALSYILTSQYNIPHGHAVSIFLPSLIRYNATHIVPDKINDKRGVAHVQFIIDSLFKSLHVSSAEEGKSAMKDFISVIGLKKPDTYFDPNIIRSNINLERMANNPVRISDNDLQNIVVDSIY